jgi:hypothetical protein
MTAVEFKGSTTTDEVPAPPVDPGIHAPSMTTEILVLPR